jgi:hypothetical protein
VEDLVAAEIIRVIAGNIAFRYPYYFHFFVARYFRDNMQDDGHRVRLRERLEYMADRVYFEE